MIHWIGMYTMARREVERTFRVVVQTLLSPTISAGLYIFIFGTVIGTQIETVRGVPYITFVFPGILMLSVINASFAASSTSLYFARFMKSIDEILIAPFSYVEMMIGFMCGGVFRALIVSALIMMVGFVFGAVSMMHPILFVVYIIAIASIFSLLGMIVALWAQGFDQLSILNTFVITPLTYLGGIFYSLAMLPETAVVITRANPFFYFVDGIRFATIGIHEGSLIIGTMIILGLLCGLLGTVFLIFRSGWRIRV